MKVETLTNQWGWPQALLVASVSNAARSCSLLVVAQNVAHGVIKKTRRLPGLPLRWLSRS